MARRKPPIRNRARSNPLQPCETRALRYQQTEQELSASLQRTAELIWAESPKLTGKFKEAHQELQHIVRELLQVRAHNRRAALRPETRGSLMHFSEASLVMLSFERFARVVMRKTDEKVNPFNLLQLARKHGVLSLTDEQIKAVNDVRNALLHGHYEQFATAEGVSVEQLFRSSKFIGAVETLTHLLDRLMREIDLDSGLPKEPPA
jgi:Mg2+ and Co2+ transporter CorA